MLDSVGVGVGGFTGGGEADEEDGRVDGGDEEIGGEDDEDDGDGAGGCCCRACDGTLVSIEVIGTEVPERQTSLV